MDKIFVFCNQKGGVGKTTTVINLAAVISEMNFRVLVVDLDPQGNATSGLGIDKSSCQGTTYDVIINKRSIEEILLKTEFNNIFVLPSNATLAGAEVELVGEYGREFVLKKAVESQLGQFDFIFIDCPPSLGLLTINALTAADSLIVPLQCEYYALEGLGQLLDIFNLVRERLNSSLRLGGVILTLADFRANLTSQVIEEVRGYFGEKVFKDVIPRSVKVSEAPGFGKPAIFYDRYNKGSLFYSNVGKEFIRRTRDFSDSKGQETDTARIQNVINS